MAATDVFTAGAAHGLVIGDQLQFTTTTTLPAGLSLLTNYYVISVPSTTTFKVSATPGGTSVDITDTGTGTHTMHIYGKAVYIGDAKDVTLSIGFAGTTPTMTVKVQGAITDVDNCPKFENASSVTNRWDLIGIAAVAQETTATGGETEISGSTGVSCSGSASFALYRLLTKLSWLCIEITANSTNATSLVDARVTIYRQ